MQKYNKLMEVDVPGGETRTRPPESSEQWVQ